MAISAPITFRFGPCDAHCLSYGTEIFTLFLLTFILGKNLFNESSLSLDMTKAAVAAAAAERDRRRDKAGEGVNGGEGAAAIATTRAAPKSTSATMAIKSPAQTVRALLDYSKRGRTVEDFKKDLATQRMAQALRRTWRHRGTQLVRKPENEEYGNSRALESSSACLLAVAHASLFPRTDSH